MDYFEEEARVLKKSKFKEGEVWPTLGGWKAEILRVSWYPASGEGISVRARHDVDGSIHDHNGYNGEQSYFRLEDYDIQLGEE